MEQKINKYYLIHIQYLGFRYHGWQKQPKLKTIESMIEKTTKFVLGHGDFKILGGSRTDSKVSANHSAFELFINISLDINQLFKDYNNNLPNDIRVIKIEEKDKTFNIINSPRIKEYIYLFSFGEKCHPFCAPFMGFCKENLNINLMKQGALLFKGKHNFKRYCTKPNPGTMFKREIILSEIRDNNLYTASFFPKISYAYHIRAQGFMRYQVRLIMGQLFSLGKGIIQLDEIKNSLNGLYDKPIRHIAPSSGLILNKIEFE